MSKQYDVVALGELLIDFTESGTSPQGNPLLEANPGGAPCNVLAMLKKYNHNVAFIGKIGRDMFGEQLRSALKEVGIDTAGLLTDDVVHTTLAFVHTAADGDRDFSFYRNPGADMMLTVDEVERCRNLLEDCAIFHFGSLSMTHDGCLKATQRAIRIAKEAGAVISFDPNLREPLWNSLEEARERIQFGLGVCDILKISDNEIVWLTGEDDYDKAVAKLKEQYDISLILVSLGRDGSLAYTARERAEQPPFLQDNTIETTGAGDTFCAGVLHSVLELGFRDYTADELNTMLRTANAGASIVTTRKGALRVMPSPAEIQNLLGE